MNTPKVDTCPHCGQSRYVSEDEKDERTVRGRRKTTIALLIVALVFAAGVAVGWALA